MINRNNWFLLHQRVTLHLKCKITKFHKDTRVYKDMCTLSDMKCNNLQSLQVQLFSQVLQETECLNSFNSFLFSVDKENVLSIWTLLHSDVLISAFKYFLPAHSHLLYMNHMVRLYFWGMHSIVICLTFHLDQPWLLSCQSWRRAESKPHITTILTSGISIPMPTATGHIKSLILPPLQQNL